MFCTNIYFSGIYIFLCFNLDFKTIGEKTPDNGKQTCPEFNLLTIRHKHNSLLLLGSAAA